MAFNVNRFVRQTTAYNAGVITTSNNPSATPEPTNGPAWFTYATLDTFSDVSQPNYFGPAAYDLAVFDRIDVSANDNSGVFTVVSVDRDLQAVTLQPYLSSGGGGGGGSISVPTLTDHIIVALDNAGTIGNILTNENKTAIFNGIIQSGLPAAGNPGFFATYSTEGSIGGRFIFQPSPNVDGADVRITNRAHESDSIVYVPDSGAPEANFLVSRFPGTQMIDAGSLEIASGDFTVTDGSVVLRVSEIGSGSLQFRHIDAGGDFFVLVQNRVMGQNTTYTIPDILQAQGAFVVSTTPFLQKLGDAIIPGGNSENEIIDDFCTTGSVVYGSWRTQANEAVTIQIFPNNGSFLIVTDVDPGASNFRYTICKPQAF